MKLFQSNRSCLLPSLWKPTHEMKGRHDIQHNDTQHDETWCKN
jgi:hypothetical protein